MRLPLPFADGTFDKLCSINTLCFWEQPSPYLLEIFRVVRSGGTIAIGFRDQEQMRPLKLSEDVFSLYSQEDVVSLLQDAGFADAQIKKREAVPFASYCAVATKP